MAESSDQEEWWSPPPPNSEVTVNSANSTQVRKTKLPLTIGVTFSIFSASIALFNLLIAWFLAPLVLEPGWWDSGETPERLRKTGPCVRGASSLNLEVFALRFSGQ